MKKFLKSFLHFYHLQWNPKKVMDSGEVEFLLFKGQLLYNVNQQTNLITIADGK